MKVLNSLSMRWQRPPQCQTRVLPRDQHRKALQIERKKQLSDDHRPREKARWNYFRHAANHNAKRNDLTHHICSNKRKTRFFLIETCRTFRSFVCGNFFKTNYFKKSRKKHKPRWAAFWEVLYTTVFFTWLADRGNKRPFLILKLRT